MARKDGHRLVSLTFLFNRTVLDGAIVIFFLNFVLFFCFVAQVAVVSASIVGTGRPCSLVLARVSSPWVQLL